MIQLRSFDESHRDAVLSIWWEAWHSIRPGLNHPKPFAAWRARWLESIEPKQTIVVALAPNGSVVGFAAADLAHQELTQIFVAPVAQRQGVGKLLFQWAQDLMPNGFVLHTLVDSVASRPFYEAFGLVAGPTELSPINGMPTMEYRWQPAARAT